MSEIIYNLCPWEGRLRRVGFFPENSWVIAAAPRGGPPTALVLTDCWQWYKRLSTDPLSRHTILASELAEDFIEHNVRMAPHMDEQGAPAMWRHNPERSLAEEIEENLERLRVFAERWVEEADDWDRRRKTGAITARPTERHRQCAQFLLYTRDWSLDIRPNLMKQCENCGTAIGATLYTCPSCKVVIDPVGLAAFKARKKAELMAVEAEQRDLNMAAERQQREREQQEA